jgi:glycosyltransferase involved in cell wall biosynthesis
VRICAIVPDTSAAPTLSASLRALREADEPPEEIVVASEPAGGRPSQARNRAATAARADLLLFVDADVVVHRDAVARIRRAFARDPGLAAVFGSYDDEPAEPGLVSRFRNLLHHHVHQSAAGPVDSFWTGLGAVRRDRFVAIGGFNEGRRLISVEDVELGMDLAAQGGRILLDPAILGTHLKRWTVRDMVRTDFARRGVPWVELLLRRRTIPTTLNLGWGHRASASAVLVAVGAAAARHPRATLAAGGVLLALNARFYALLLRRGGPRLAAAGIPLHALHLLTGAAALPAGLAAHLAGRGQATRSSSSASSSGPSSR